MSENYHFTFNNIFGAGGGGSGSLRASPAGGRSPDRSPNRSIYVDPPAGGRSPITSPRASSPRDLLGHREEFGVGFMRSESTFSPAPRTRCIQDIIMRDATGQKNSLHPAHYFDKGSATRNNPTTNATSTTHQDYTRSKPTQSRDTRDYLGFRDGLARQKDLQREAFGDHGGVARKQPPHMTHADRSPGGSPITSPRELGVSGVPRPLVQRREDMRTSQVGGIMFNAPDAHSPTNSPRGVSPTGGGARKQYASRHTTSTLCSGLDDGRSGAVVHEEFQDASRAGAKLSQHPTASIELGDNAEINPTSKTLGLREDTTAYGSKNLLKKCKSYDPADRINEWQYRTREVAWGRRSEAAKGRWK